MAEIDPELLKLVNIHKNTKSALDSLIDDNDLDFSTKMLNHFNGRRIMALEKKTMSMSVGTIYNVQYYPDRPDYEFYLHIKFDNGNVGCSSLEYVEFIDGL